MGSGASTAVELRNNSGSLGLQVLVRRINVALVLEQERTKETVVDGDSALEEENQGRGHVRSAQSTKRTSEQRGKGGEGAWQPAICNLGIFLH